MNVKSLLRPYPINIIEYIYATDPLIQKLAFETFFPLSKRAKIYQSMIRLDEEGQNKLRSKILNGYNNYYQLFVESNLEKGLYYIINNLDERYKEIINYRFNERKTRSEIAKFYKLSIPLIKTNEERVLYKIKNHYLFPLLFGVDITDEENLTDNIYKRLLFLYTGKKFNLLNFYSIPIYSLGFSTPTIRTCYINNIEVLGDIIDLINEDKLYKIYSLGKGRMEEIYRALEALHFPVIMIKRKGSKKYTIQIKEVS